MPQMDGMELLRRVREMGGDTGTMPVIFLTSKDEELDEALVWRWARTTILQAILAAAPDRAHPALLRRQDLARRGQRRPADGEEEPPLIERGRLVMDPARHKVLWDGKDVTLTVTEFLILEALAQRPAS